MLSGSKNQTISAHVVNESKEVTKQFSFHAPKTTGANEGGVYLDENGVKWLLKSASPTDVVREALASQIYRNLVGPDHGPEVLLLRHQSQWLVASKWCDGLEKFDVKAQGLAPMFVAAYIIQDVDCYPKNIANLKGKNFRFDFFASLRTTEADQKKLIEITSIFQLINSTAQPHDMDIALLITYIKNLTTCQVDEKFWGKVYAEALETEKSLDPKFIPDKTLDISVQLKFCQERIVFLTQLIREFEAKQEHKIEPSENLGELQRLLVDFYQFIAGHMRPLIANYAEQMAERHFAWLHKNNMQHPDFFSTLTTSALSSLSMDHLCQLLNKPIDDKLHQFHSAIKTRKEMIDAHIATHYFGHVVKATVPKPAAKADLVTSLLNHFLLRRNSRSAKKFPEPSNSERLSPSK